jgi:2-hydroxychromene-2-carboxylate isomerase
MSQQFKDQGGAATMDPSPLARRLTSNLASYLNSEKKLMKRRLKAEKARKKDGRPHVVDYFHQVEDGYSHLASQVLEQFAQRYDIELRCHIARGPEGKNAPDAALLLKLSQYDSALIAGEYGLKFPGGSNPPSLEAVSTANALLANASQADLPGLLVAVGDALWSFDEAALGALVDQHGCASPEDTEARLNAATALRAQLKHYSGAMFHYEGEWYWGVDRLHYLEARLAGLGADRQTGQPYITQCPDVSIGGVNDASELTLEFFPSLRSPYTSIVFDETVELAKKAGVNLLMRPVLPMVMRGVPATREKGMYIFSDTAREARRRGVAYGNMYDPIGNPVRRCYSLYPWAVSQGKGNELLSSFLKHAFALGVNTNNNRGLKRIVESAGLSWGEAKKHLGETEWEALLETNRLSMYEGGLWGVPSYRLIDAEGQTHLEIWGQDRLWLVAREIRRLHRES